MKISEEYLEAMPMVFARRTGAYGEENRALMEKFKKWASEKGYMTDDAVILAISRDDPGIVPPGKCRYDVCLPGEYDDGEAWIEKGRLERGKYAVLEIPHTAEALALVWQEGIARLMKTGYKLDFSRPIIERYKKALVDSGYCEMLFPVL